MSVIHSSSGWRVERHLFEDAERHLERGVALARRIGRPYLEFISLAYQAVTKVIPSVLRAGERAEQAIELAERHGWTDEPAAGYAYALRGAVLTWQGRPEEAEPWAQRAEHTLRPEAEPAVALLIHHIRGQLELARGRDADALAAFQAAERLAGRLAAPHLLIPSARALVMYALVRLGETERAEQVFADLSDQDQQHGEMRIAAAALRLAQDDPHAATIALGPVLDGSATQIRRSWLIQAFVLEAIARDTLGDPAAADRSAERTTPPSAGPRPPFEPLSKTETRVLRYLPTHLSAPEIATELSVAPSTVKTHLRDLYAKLGAHRRAEAVERARALGLLAPSAHRR